MASSAAADRAREEQSGEIPAEFVYNQDAASPEEALGTKQEAQERATERAGQVQRCHLMAVDGRVKQK